MVPSGLAFPLSLGLTLFTQSDLSGITVPSSPKGRTQREPQGNPHQYRHIRRSPCSAIAVIPQAPQGFAKFGCCVSELLHQGRPRLVFSIVGLNRHADCTTTPSSPEVLRDLKELLPQVDERLQQPPAYPTSPMPDQSI
mmetsp:Transcript_30145/g.92250  ORF Transcript_30145/g.92250 Transcript_30145/m.92250 type:complete len:139 (-) Transcript_30145:819-1235(-)|eukprot:scaffold216990_cov28-Tisochrysis_lutea.AAC.4